MAHFFRTKRVTDPLDERVKDRIFGRDRPHQPGSVSSGSEHSASSNQNDDNSTSSLCLSDLLHCFLEHDGGEEESTDRVNAGEEDRELQNNDSDSDCDSDRTEEINQVMLSMLRNQNVDRFRNVLLGHVLKAMEVFHSLRPNKQILQRNVMLFLQNHGYNAAICKTKWESCGGLTAGNYEFIDVVPSDSGSRYFIDLNFAGEFEIARQTNQFRRLLQNLPTVFVARIEDLKQIVKLMSDAARRSLKSRGLLLPPWRKNRFMQNKWIGPYRRTANYIPASFSSSLTIPANRPTPVVKCRSIGFNAVNSSPLPPAAARTR